LEGRKLAELSPRNNAGSNNGGNGKCTILTTLPILLMLYPTV